MAQPMLKGINDDLIEASRLLSSDVIKTGEWTMEFLHECILVTGERYFQGKYEEVEVLEPTSLVEIKIPYFFK